jgi:hypothetical protein|tara:strand:- start:414 stop:722 length:309 start_codon:yes stop_codon:yes gene_type:complete
MQTLEFIFSGNPDHLMDDIQAAMPSAVRTFVAPNGWITSASDSLKIKLSGNTLTIRVADDIDAETITRLVNEHVAHAVPLIFDWASASQDEKMEEIRSRLDL